MTVSQSFWRDQKRNRRCDNANCGSKLLRPRFSWKSNSLIQRFPNPRALTESTNRATDRSAKPYSLLAVTNPEKNLCIKESPAKPFFHAADFLELFGDEATVDRVKVELPHRTHLCFYCHGGMDISDPQKSGLVLAGSRWLTAGDLRSLSLRSTRLAVLAACETGIGDIRFAPDEFSGLPGSLLEAGVPCVIASLWPVEAQATAALVQELFSSHILDGLSPAAALRLAQLACRDARGPGDLYQVQGGVGIPRSATVGSRIADDLRPSPYFWAAFACYGT